LLREPGLLGFQRDIFRAEQLDLQFRGAVKNKPSLPGQPGAQGMRQKNLGQLELARFELRLNVLDKMQEGLFRVAVLSMTGHGDVAPGRLLIERGGQFAAIQQPALERGGGLTPRGGGFELVKQGRDLAPIPQIHFVWNEAARPEDRQFSERQQIHARRIASRPVFGDG
jgi:hypothetical protein